MTTATPDPISSPTSPAPPPPQPPPDIVRLRLDVPGEDYRQLRHVAIETAVSVNELACESVKMLLRWYAAQGIPAVRPTP